MDKNDQFFQNSHYNIIRILLSVSGIWPFHSRSKRCAIYFGFLLILGSGFIFEVLGMVEVWRDLFEMIDCFPMFSLSVVPMAKLICAIYTLPEIKILLIKMQEYWYSPKTDEEIKILHSFALYGRNLGYAYMGIVLSHTVVFESMTLLTKIFYVKPAENSSLSNAHGAQVGLPYRVNYMVDLNTYYAPIFIHTAMCDVFHTTLMITFDVFYLTLVQHCCGLFAAMRYRLENAFEFKNDGDNLMSMTTKNKLHSNIVYSIRRHAEAIKFATVTESIHRIPLFVNLGANISLLSILGFQMITNTKDINRIITYAIYFSALLLNTFFNNWQGQKMIDSSEKVYESVYNAEWYNMPVAQRKLYIMIMIRSKNPLRITAGNFVVLSYVNFNAVLRAASSYFMLLRSVQ